MLDGDARAYVHSVCPIHCRVCHPLKHRQVDCQQVMERGGFYSATNASNLSHVRSFILADTDQLHHKIAEMSHRIRQLEDGLAILQASVSSERHPLLTDDLVKIKFGPEAPRSVEVISSKDSTEKVTVESIDALGTLTLNSDGEMRYFGRSAGSQVSMIYESTICLITLHRHLWRFEYYTSMENADFADW